MKKKIDLKKTQVFAMISIALMVMVSFTAVANTPILNAEEFENGPAIAFEEASDSRADSVSYEIPDYIDLTGYEISEEELANLHAKAEFANELVSLAQEYKGEELPFVDVPVIIDGAEVMTVPMMGNEFTEHGGEYVLEMFMGGSTSGTGSLYCLGLLLSAILGFVLALLAAFMCIMGDALSCSMVSSLFIGAKAALDLWQRDCSGGSSGSSVQATIDTIMNGDIVEISEIRAIVDMTSCAN